MPAFPNSFYAIADKAVGTLNADITSGSTFLALNTGEGGAFPTADFCIRLDAEIIYVTSRSADTFNTLTRGYAGTTAAAHTAGRKIRLPWMREYYDRIVSNLTGHTHVRADITDFSHTHPQGDITNLVADLAAKEDDANKNVANGYAGLDAGIRVPTARLGSGTADSTTFLRGDQTYAVPAGGSASYQVFLDFGTREVTFT